MAATTLLALAAGTQAVAGAGNAYSQASAQRAQGAYAKQQYDFNAQAAEMQAADTIQRGAKASNAVERKVRQTVGAQRVAAAAQGLDPNTDTAADLQDESSMLGEFDKLVIQNNAWREAAGLKSEAANYRGRGAMAQNVGENSAKSTLLTGGLQFLAKGAEAAAYASKGASSKSQPKSPYPSGGSYPSADDWAEFYGAPK